MNKSLSQLLGHSDGEALPLEVEEELRFHIEMQAGNYETEGLPPQEALAKAEMRFGDFAQIKSQCIQISMRNGGRTQAMKVLFTIAFLLGVLVRTLSTEYHVTHIGDVLIMIAIFGGLLLVGKRMRAGDFGRAPEPIRLGLHRVPNSTPRAFDENGRTPFERVRADD